ncbi:alpha-N-acetylglucosaminidase-like [Acanthaster planci]|uniref:Alpha-N-acetylglucosaminidase-like n=1 Tax=Acanthaster planci TaxID=133434 RepID=A0A8B7ZDI4_ACAPL|nr:alpha-N-acetylglucosaminidase-like [Acanthaster planci]
MTVRRLDFFPQSFSMSLLRFAPSIITILVACCYALEFESLNNIKTQTSPDDQAKAVTALIKRLIPDQAAAFTVVVNSSIGPPNLDTFEIKSHDNKVSITGTTGVAAAWGFHHYLKHYCGCHISWAGNQLNIPSTLPTVKPALKITSPNRFRYYQNVCTVSYSFAWWNWTRWEREIDWMAMNGINLPLAFNAQEAIWQKVYLNMGFTQKDLDTHFGGPAFLAWTRIGNIHGWGGPLTPSWHANQIKLQHQILKRMRDLGMTPVLPAFAGHVPDATIRLFPKANIINGSIWGKFSKDRQYCCTKFLVPSDPLFKRIGKTFIETMMAEFNGTDHVYNADLFNEMNPVSNDLGYLASASRGVYETIISADPKGIWLMQGWLFTSNGFWFKEQIKAHLTAVPLGRLIILDLASDILPVFDRTNSFYGQPFIWCMLHNFGGNHGLYGRLDYVNKAVFASRMFPGSTMVGTGLTPEGIEQNDVMYGFMNDLTWRTQPVNVTAWIDSYAVRRYGKFTQQTQRAWRILKDTIYNSMENTKEHNRNALVMRPSLTIDPDVWYDWKEVAEAWPLMINAATDLGTSLLYRYDLVDIGRQVLQDIAMVTYAEFLTFIHMNKKTLASLCLEKFLDILLDMDTLLATDSHWLLGNWIQSAKALGTSIKEQKWLEYNARNQITIWGPHAEINDYANKQWAGLMKSYYHRRWSLFAFEFEHAHQLWNQTRFNELCLNTIEIPWTYNTSDYTTVPIGDSIKVSHFLFEKYKEDIWSGRDGIVQVFDVSGQRFQRAKRYPPQ